MFFTIDMTKEIELHPKFFGPQLRDILKRKLKEEVEGTCSGKFGYIVCVPVMHEIGQGVIREGTGFAQFRVRHTAIAFRPFKGEVMDTVVTSVSKMGFFAEAGPVSIFVSNHLIPDEFSFVAADEPSFVSADEAVRIVAGAEARLRIVGTRVDATEIVRLSRPSSPLAQRKALTEV